MIEKIRINNERESDSSLYTSPIVEVMEIRVESGFAGSNEKFGEKPVSNW